MFTIKFFLLIFTIIFTIIFTGDVTAMGDGSSFSFPIGETSI